MDFTENEKALKLTAYISAAVWAIAAGIMLSPLDIHLGWLIVLCHLVSAFCAYCIKDYAGDNPAGWVFTMLCCPALAPVIMRRTDAAALIGAFIAGVLFLIFYVLVVLQKGSPDVRTAVAIGLLVLWFGGIVYAAKIAKDNFRNPWLWGIGCGLFPPLLLILVLLETDLDRVPGGWILRAIGKGIGIILSPLLALLSKIGELLEPARDKVDEWFSSSSVSKSCGACGRSVSAISRAGGRCPYCGAYWSSEHTTRR
ncbi:MAG: hypothetical protein ACRCUT_10775 [Spirochaetota bacterium]